LLIDAARNRSIGNEYDPYVVDKKYIDEIKERFDGYDLSVLLDCGPHPGALSVDYQNAKDFPLLSAEQETELLKLYNQDIDYHIKMAARDILVAHNVRLVNKIAKKFLGRGLEFKDLRQEGYGEGLLTGIEGYDLDSGYKLSTHTYGWITQAITRAIMNCSSSIRVPVHMVEKLNRVKATLAALAEQGISDPSDEDLAEELSETVESVHAALEAMKSQRTTSLNSKTSNEADATELGDLIADGSNDIDDYIDRIALRDTLDTVVKLALASPAINNGELWHADFIRMRFSIDPETGIRPSLVKCAKKFGVSPHRGQQIEARIYKYIRFYRNQPNSKLGF
jgi:RNA polymerase primary sigma factor